ncbi:unnamed protein product [Clonostachys rhizophaga]|uniref:DUF7779 domain-containing protein n=1 Tax=Clonostachys rhizophaga TaxID=160324 RepID=A0A9N9YHN6_9HYPO|nr:unnamed protein product [Clonostachys rhizophaga]
MPDMRKIFRRREKKPSTALPTSAPLETSVPPILASLATAPTTSEFPNRKKILSLGIKVLHSPEPCDVDNFSIVFIHGLSGDREKTWTGPNQTEPWPKTILPDRLPTARMLVFGYDAKWLKDSSSRNRVQEHASNLLASLGRHRGEDGTSSRPIIFVCHSLGGLVCMDALVLSEQQGGQHHLPKIHEQTIGIQFLGTPHQGSDFASWAKLVSRYVFPMRQTNSDITRVLRKDSEELARIQHSFHLRLQLRPQLGLPAISITYFFEELPTPHLGVIVPKESATRPGCNNIGIHANHSNMTKFEDANDDGLLKVSGELRRYIEVAKQASPNARLDVDEQATIPFTVPYSTNENFVGRIDILRQLESCFDLSNIDRTWQPRIALYGLGGIGKTQIAIQFTYWLQRRYPEVAVYWVHASNADRFRQSFTSIAQDCGIPGLDDPGNDVLPLVKAWLGKKDNGRWLMVIDNADDEALFTTSGSSSRSSGNLGGFIPDCANGNILITTRNKKAGSRLTKGKQLIEIGRMDISDCVKLLRLQLDDAASTESIRRLSDQLEYIPLALAQAAAFIRENVLSIDYYLELLMKRPVDLLGEEFEAVGRDEESLHAVAATWMISFQQIQQRNPLAGELLSLMSFFDRQEIPRVFLLNYYERRNNGKDGALEVTKAIGHLLSFSLIKEEASQNINIHRLVQVTTRKWLSNQHHEDAYQGEALLTVWEMFPNEQNVENWPTCTAYLPHAQVVRGLTSSRRNREVKRADLLTNIGCFFHDEGRWKEAEETHKEAGAIYREVFGEENPNTLNSMADLASTFRSLGRLEEAEKLQIKLLELYKRILGEAHPYTLTVMNNLATTFYSLGRLEEAEKLQIKVLELYKRILGEEHPETLTSKNNLASTFYDLGRLEEAEKLLVKVLELRKTILGEEHPGTLRSINNLASTFWEQGRLEEAEKLQIKVLELRQRVLGEEHPDTLNSMNNLASGLCYLGRLEEAEQLQIKSLELHERVLGEKHPDTLNSINSLASGLYYLGRLEEAEQLQIKALELGKRVFGEEHYRTLDSMSNLSHMWRKLNRPNEAVEMMTECTALQKRILGGDHPSTLASIKTLGSWLSSPMVETNAQQEEHA